MTESDKNKIIKDSWVAHTIVEESYQQNRAVKGDSHWLDKQRVLLADMALHLLQTALNSGELQQDKLRNNLFSILTIAEQFLPDTNLSQVKNRIY